MGNEKASVITYIPFLFYHQFIPFLEKSKKHIQLDVLLFCYTLKTE